MKLQVPLTLRNKTGHLLLPLFILLSMLVYNAYIKHIDIGHLIKLQVPLTLRNKTVEFPWWDGGECSNRTPIIYDDTTYGNCGRRAWALGAGQKIISMCVYGKNSQYFNGMEENLNIMKKFYPEYILRLHLNPRLFKDRLCPLLMKYDHLYVCDITDLPSGIGNIEKIHGMGWRFSPTGDPQVDVMLVRDSDSRIIEREVRAVHEWLASKRTLHVMNDYPFDKLVLPMPGGLWGVRSDLDKMYSMGITVKTLLNTMRENMFHFLKHKHSRFDDMYALKKFVYQALNDDMVRHDSYKCQHYPGSWPWPTSRNKTVTHVGMPSYRLNRMWVRVRHMRCPKECRPSNHQDWEYC